MATVWIPERCCPDPSCPGSWFVLNKMTHHIGDDGTERQGVFPTLLQAQEWCDKANRDKTSVTQA